MIQPITSSTKRISTSTATIRARTSKNYDDSDAHPLIGVERLRPFTEWLKEHHARGFIGEFGVPDDDPRWLEVLDRFLAARKAEQIAKLRIQRI